MIQKRTVRPFFFLYLKIGDFMLRMKRKIIAYILVFIVTAFSCFGMYSVKVEASEYFDIGIQIFQFALAHGAGAAVSDDLVQSLYDEYEDFINSISYTVNPDGTITFSEEAIQQLRDLFDEYLAEHPENIDVVWLPVITEKDLKASWFSDLDKYNAAMELFEDHDLIGLNRYFYSNPPIRGLSYFDFSDLVIYKGSAFTESFIQDVSTLADVFGRSPNPSLNFRSYFVSRTGVQTIPTWYSLNSFGEWVHPSTTSYNAVPWGLYNPFYLGSLSTTNGWYEYFIPVASSKSNITFVPVFSTQGAYMDWITGSGSYYRFDSGYTGGDITINPDADYSEILDAITEAIRQSVENGEEMSKILSDMQEAFNKALKDLSGALDDIGDNTEKTNTWLEKIYELLQDQQDQLQDYFESAGGSLEDLLQLLGHLDENGHNTNLFLSALLSFLQNQEQELQDYFDSAGGSLEELVQLLGHVDEDGHTTNSLLSDLLGMLQEQREELGDYIAAAKEYPDKLHEWLIELEDDVVDAIKDVVKAVKGIDFGDHTGVGSESLWTQLGKGFAKILTAVLNLLKVLIFKGLDALGYLAGIMIDNIGQVFEGIGVYFDRYIGYIEENTFFAAIRDILPEELQTIFVLSFFSIAVAGIIKYAKKG